ncbi:DUF3093 domain-containing protein [Corynebacterium choanae]|uniref:DUF3093 domain-containing protein n=1 Tax=Corynebacterium choanae TaxID=1862358 RepID=A0A3G6J778_9CORY|nr:DUF3093 domain-containing protein [Corynebacterium choanae]AZA13729.1 hypothetical protein CCHOA_06685 [Corynebacterium choanae]
MSDLATSPTHGTVVYREKLSVPKYWWLLAAGAVGLLTGQLAYNRSIMFLVIPLILFTLTAIWILLKLSSTVITVEEDSDGVRWLHAGGAALPADAVQRTLAVPKSAKQNAMGRQLDPAAFVVSHGWIGQMAMFVLVDDPTDPVPYWLISTNNPNELIAALTGSPA